MENIPGEDNGLGGIIVSDQILAAASPMVNCTVVYLSQCVSINFCQVNRTARSSPEIYVGRHIMHVIRSDYGACRITGRTTRTLNGIDSSPTNISLELNPTKFYSTSSEFGLLLEYLES